MSNKLDKLENLNLAGIPDEPVITKGDSRKHLFPEKVVKKKESGRYAELQAFMDMAVNSPKALRLEFKDPAAARSFRNRFYKKRAEWKNVFLRRNGNLTSHPLDPENLQGTDPELVEQIKESFPNLKKLNRYHWQSPYELVSCFIDEENDPSAVLLYNTMFVREPGSSVISYDFVD